MRPPLPSLRHRHGVLRLVTTLTLLFQTAAQPALSALSNTGRWTDTPSADWVSQGSSPHSQTAVHLMLIPGTSSYHSRIVWWDHDHLEPTEESGPLAGVSVTSLL